MASMAPLVPVRQPKVVSAGLLSLICSAARRYTDPAYIYKMTDNWNPNK